MRGGTCPTRARSSGSDVL